MIRWIIGGVGASLVVILFILWTKPGRQTQSSKEQLTKTDVKPSVPIEEKSTRSIPERPVVSVAPRQTQVNQNQPNDSRSEQERKALELLRPKAAGQIELLKRVYRRESSDATSQDTERRIREEFGPKDLPVEALQNVTCHRSVCKIEMFWSEQHPLVLVALTMTVGPLLTGHMAFDPAPEPDRKGRLLVDAYVVRPGYDTADFE